MSYIGRIGVRDKREFDRQCGIRLNSRMSYMDRIAARLQSGETGIRIGARTYHVIDRSQYVGSKTPRSGIEPTFIVRGIYGNPEPIFYYKRQ